jgi:hypothetical protein
MSRNRYVPAILATAVMLGCLCVVASPALAGDATTASACKLAEASPGFRVSLPDCRAYELVTPVYGGGQPPFGLFRVSPPMSANGEHILGIAFAPYAGTENLEQYGLEYGAVYEYSRSETGWNAEAQDPPASEFPRSDFKFASADLSRSLWEVVLPVHDGEELGALTHEYDGFTLAVREAAGGGKGRFTLIGRVTAPKHGPEAGLYEVMGASEDLSHILLSVTAEGEQLWPGDTTQPGAQSLYEYHDVSGREPVLVGVRNEGLPPWTAGAERINEGAALVSQCGTQYNAVSANGERVYFTAAAANLGPSKDACTEAGEGTGPAVNELYGRVGGAKTVAISEPATEDCLACNISKVAQEEAPEGATFQGASTDGEQVFFTTKQMLLPGAENGRTGLYEYDAEAPMGERVKLLAKEVASVAAVSEDGTRIYFNSETELTNEVDGNGEHAEAAHNNLYVYDTVMSRTRPALSFVGQEIFGERTSPDGEYLVFESMWPFKGTNDKSTTVPQLFEYDASTGQIVRVSAGQRSPGVAYECAATKTFEEGYNCDGNTEATEFAPKATGASPESFFSKPTEASSHLTVTKEGTVVFTSALALTPDAREGRVIAAGAGSRAENVYEYEAGHLNLISPADELSGIQVIPGQSRLLGIDETGKDVFFATTNSLVPQDTDTQYSWYDAREEGGFPAPSLTPGCLGAATCQGGLTAPPALSPVGGSASAAAGGNLAPPTPVVSKPKPLSRAQKLAKALEACKRISKKQKRELCQRQARRKYGHVAGKASSGRRGK